MNLLNKKATANKSSFKALNRTALQTIFGGRKWKRIVKKSKVK